VLLLCCFPFVLLLAVCIKFRGQERIISKTLGSNGHDREIIMRPDAVAQWQQEYNIYLGLVARKYPFLKILSN